MAYARFGAWRGGEGRVAAEVDTRGGSRGASARGSSAHAGAEEPAPWRGLGLRFRRSATLLLLSGGDVETTRAVVSASSYEQW